MKSSLIVVLLVACLFLTACASSQKLSGIAFSKVEVIGDESTLATDLIRHYMIQQGSKLDVEKAPSIIVHSHIEHLNGKVEAVALLAETSTGVTAIGSANSYDTGSSSLQHLMSDSARDLIESLGNKVKKTESSNL